MSADGLDLPAGEEFVPERGWVASVVSSEFAGLELLYATVAAKPGRSPRVVKQRLSVLSDRFRGGDAVTLRQRPIPSAYRVFYRHIGLDPDDQPTPVEAVALERMRAGRFASKNTVDDALTIATIETSVAIRALDADRVEGTPGVRTTAAGEPFEGRSHPLPEGTLVIADERRPLGLLFGEAADGRGVSPKTRRIMLVSVMVKGVPEIAAEEALWLAAAVLRTRQ